MTTYPDTSSTISELVDNISTYVKATSNEYRVSELLLLLLVIDKCQKEIEKIKSIHQFDTHSNQKMPKDTNDYLLCI
tara:strand:+ start:11496 stop:11726 length:231 start_codon:yes stop_codon:yes gene_type:complete